MVIADVMLPRMSSLQLSAWLRARRPGLKVLHISRQGNAPGVAEIAADSGNGPDLIEKSTTMESLSGKIRTLLGRTL
jgi:DNA-binding response OmpR family regulator